MLAVAVGAAGVGGLACDRGEPPKKVSFGPDREVYYTTGVSEAQARKVGETLERLGFLRGPGWRRLRVSRSEGGFTIAVALPEGGWENERLVRAFRLSVSSLSEDALDGKPVEIHLCDEKMNSKKVIR